MYDSHIFCEEYEELEEIISDIVSGFDVETDIEELEVHIKELYENGKMSSYQYDDLMSYLHDIK